MKKFFAIFLCAAISCQLYMDLKNAGYLKEEDEVGLRRIADIMKSQPYKIAKSLHNMPVKLQNGVKFWMENGLLENTVIVIYGDHDARLPKNDYLRLYNYDKETDGIIDKDDPEYFDYDSYQYELGRKVPFIIWTKDMAGSSLNMEIKDIMGMYDAMPTLGNMLGFYNKYQLGHDIFNVRGNNIVCFPNGNWVTDKIYFNSQKNEYLSLNGEAISEEEIQNNTNYTNELLEVSNQIILFNLLKEDSQIYDMKE